MAQAPITIELPGSTEDNKREAVVRSFVKNKDRKAIQRISLKDTEIDPEEVKDDQVRVKMRAENMVDVTSEQVRRLLISYLGNTDDPYEALLESEHEEDMDAVEEAVQKIFDKGGDADANAKKSKKSASNTRES